MLGAVDVKLSSSSQYYYHAVLADIHRVFEPSRPSEGEKEKNKESFSSLVLLVLRNKEKAREERENVPHFLLRRRRWGVFAWTSLIAVSTHINEPRQLSFSRERRLVMMMMSVRIEVCCSVSKHVKHTTRSRRSNNNAS